jgi:hypothetical protein
MLGWSRPRLSARAAVSDLTIQKFEEGHRPADRKIVAIQRALEAAGVEFTNGGEPGREAQGQRPVKRPLKPNRKDYRQRDPTWFLVAVIVALATFLALALINRYL